MGAELGEDLLRQCNFTISKRSIFRQDQVSFHIAPNSIVGLLERAQQESSRLFGRGAMNQRLFKECVEYGHLPLEGVTVRAQLKPLKPLYSLLNKFGEPCCVQTLFLCDLNTGQALSLPVAALAHALYFFRTTRDWFGGEFVGVADGLSDISRKGQYAALKLESNGLYVNRPGSIGG
jgi:hypothetical protein